MPVVVKEDFNSYEESVSAALDRLFSICPEEKIPQNGLIILKPNLTTSSPPPVTTPVGMVRAVYEWLRPKTGADFAVGEGCGSGNTMDLFRQLGYASFAEEEGLELIDFNTAESVRMKAPEAFTLKEFCMPAVLQEAYIVSIPILKDHSFTGTTIAMKNMFGAAPAKYYRGSWNKSKLHSPSTDLSVVDVCRYCRPHLSVVDAVTALTGMHLAGTPLQLNTILAGFDPVAIDAVGSSLLGHSPEDLEYLVKADGLIGSIRNINII